MMPAKPELLADHGQDHVGVRLGQVEELLHALAEADAERPAGADRDHRLHRLEARALRVSAHGSRNAVRRSRR